jgi:hypothetical protein
MRIKSLLVIWKNVLRAWKIGVENAFGKAWFVVVLVALTGVGGTGKASNDIFTLFHVHRRNEKNFIDFPGMQHFFPPYSVSWRVS